MDDQDRAWVERRLDEERRRLLGALGQLFKELFADLRGELGAVLHQQMEPILRKADELLALTRRLEQVDRKLQDEPPTDDAKLN